MYMLSFAASFQLDLIILVCHGMDGIGFLK